MNDCLLREERGGRREERERGERGGKMEITNSTSHVVSL
jgi:hypothetical protein